jgi:hypothetical protein
MNWEALGAIGEIGGAIAVVASLVYLGSQIRYSAKATEASIRRDIADAAQQGFLTGVESPEFTLIIRKGFNGEELEDTEQFQFLRFVTGVMLNYEVAFHQYLSGLYPEWETYLCRRMLVNFRNSRYTPAWWKHVRETMFSEEFVAEVDRVIKEEGIEI